MRLLFIGDVVGSIGCEFLRKRLPELKRQYEAEIVIVNGENSADGNGMTVYSAEQIFQAGADVITTGNHAFQRKADLRIYENDCILRPANYGEACIGKGVTVLDMGSCQVAVINLMGVLFMENLENPFTEADNILKKLDTPNIFVDFHAEATSEKRAMGFHLAGRVTAVIGTHTHVQTADASILEGHTGYLTDAGMTGVEDSVLGTDKKIALERMHLHIPKRYQEAKGACYLNGVMIEFEKKCGKCTKIEPLIVR